MMMKKRHTHKIRVVAVRSNQHQKTPKQQRIIFICFGVYVQGTGSLITISVVLCEWAVSFSFGLDSLGIEQTNALRPVMWISFFHIFYFYFLLSLLRALSLLCILLFYSFDSFRKFHFIKSTFVGDSCEQFLECTIFYHTYVRTGIQTNKHLLIVSGVKNKSTYQTTKESKIR